MAVFLSSALLIGIWVGIIALFVQRKKTEASLGKFYEENSLFTTKDEPPNIRDSLRASDNLYCCRAPLVTAAGASVEYCWWEWNLKSTVVTNKEPTPTYTYLLAISFAPHVVSDAFVQQALAEADKSQVPFAQKLKDYFVPNTQRPYRAEELADGSFLICWQVLKKREVYDAKLEWLKNNVTLRA